MASAVPVRSGMPFCANCSLFHWKQLENQEPLPQCKRCHVITYCGRECQEEHWHKVHRKHCKYLGGIKKAKHSEHQKDTCYTCIASSSLGDLVFSPTNPNYACIFEHIHWSVLPPSYPHPFPVTGLPEDRIEQMLNVAQKILLKIKVTKHPIYLKEQEAIDQLETELWKMKGEMYICRICGIDKDHVKAHNRLQKTFIEPIPRRPWIALGCKFDNRKDQDWCKLWATFALLIELMHSTNILALENSLKNPNSLPKDYRQVSKKDEFLEVADKIIEALNQEVVSFSDLASIACGGNPEQNCSQCKKKIVVRGIFLPLLQAWRGQERASTADIIFNAIETKRYICKSSKCFEKEKVRHADKFCSWMTAVLATGLRLCNTRCDHCFLNQVHRSKCRTKNYCSQVCRDADDAVHKVCCNPDEGERRIDERKVKIGGKDKAEAANAATKSVTESMCKIINDPAGRQRVVGIIEKTKKAKGRVKRAKGKVAKVDEVD